MGLLENYPVWAAFFGAAMAQVLKVVLILFTEKKLKMARLTETGGMPSSHSAGVAALAAACAMKFGLDSGYFAISIVFGTIVIYDAAGVRRAAGRHAEILNTLMTELAHLFEEGNSPKALKTLLGHTYPQVLVGTLLGIGTGIATHFAWIRWVVPRLASL
jgi:acid phosphatase family membrane protein YuiD